MVETNKFTTQNSKAFIDQRKYNIIVATCLLGLIPTIPPVKASNFHDKWVITFRHETESITKPWMGKSPRYLHPEN